MAWDDFQLCQDEDLTQVESRMPAQAKAMRSGMNASPYDGKRDLAKRVIATHLRKRGIDPEGVQTPDQLKLAAVYQELSLIYRDMSSRGDSNAEFKAELYASMYNDELEALHIDYQAPMTPEPPRAFLGIPLRRG
jgi:hypothetical protein